MTLDLGGPSMKALADSLGDTSMSGKTEFANSLFKTPPELKGAAYSGCWHVLLINGDAVWLPFGCFFFYELGIF